MEIKLLKLAVERLYDQVEQLNLEMKKMQEEMTDLKTQATSNAQCSTKIEVEYIDTKEVQQILGVCYNTLQRVVEAGYLKPIRINQRRVRYNRADVIQYLEHGS